MPTGYTAQLMEKGQAFPDFVMQCARAMGACVMMRDNSMDDPIPKFEPSDYHARKLAESKAELLRLLAMTDEEKIAFGQNKRANQIKRHEEWLAKNKEENTRLIQMRQKVGAWEPPTIEHKGLKEFMLQQIEVSMNSLDYIEREIIKDKASFARDYYDLAVAEAEKDIPYQIEEDHKERERTNGRNRWIAELRASLKENAP